MIFSVKHAKLTYKCNKFLLWIDISKSISEVPLNIITSALYKLHNYTIKSNHARLGHL